MYNTPMQGFLAAVFLSIAALFPHGVGASVHALFYDMFPLAAPHTKVLFGGDLMFDRAVRATVDTKGGDYVFSCIDSLLKSEDLVVANLEGPITASTSISAGSLPGDSNNFTFTFPITTADLLASHNIRLVNLGNNHILNFGWTGANSTTAALSSGGIGYFGDPQNSTVANRKLNQVPLAFINYNEFSPWGATAAASTTVAQIRSERAAGNLPIVYTHWGVEYSPATDNEKALAHQFIDAGAEMVIGSHPHVVQEHEIYKGKYIYYSLGNFVFDQYWDDAVTHGLLLEVAITSTEVVSVKEIPIEIQHGGRPCPVPEDAKSNLINS